MSGISHACEWCFDTDCEECKAIKELYDELDNESQ